MGEFHLKGLSSFESAPLSLPDDDADIRVFVELRRLPSEPESILVIVVLGAAPLSTFIPLNYARALSRFARNDWTICCCVASAVHNRNRSNLAGSRIRGVPLSDTVVLFQIPHDWSHSMC